MGDIKLEVIENDFAEATQDLHPKKEKPAKGKKKKPKHQQTTWSENLLAGLGCGNAVPFSVAFLDFLCFAGDFRTKIAFFFEFFHCFH